MASINKLTCYSDPADHYCHRIRLVLAEKNVAVEVIDIEAGRCPPMLAGKEAERVQARKELRESLTGVSPLFADKAYFLSEDFSLVDCCLLPILWRLPLLGIELPRQAKPLLDYMERGFARESFRASLSSVERDMR